MTDSIRSSVSLIDLKSYRWINRFLWITPEEVHLFDENGEEYPKAVVVPSTDGKYADIRKTYRTEFAKVFVFYHRSERLIQALSQSMGMLIESYLIK